MKAYIYIVLLHCDFSLVPHSSTDFSSSKDAPCIMGGCKAFPPTSKPGMGRRGAGIGREGIPVSPPGQQGGSGARLQTWGTQGADLTSHSHRKVEGRERQASIY